MPTPIKMGIPQNTNTRRIIRLLTTSGMYPEPCSAIAGEGCGGLTMGTPFLAAGLRCLALLRGSNGTDGRGFSADIYAGSDLVKVMADVDRCALSINANTSIY